MSIGGLVLAGGRSERMGRDKALIEVAGGVRLVDRAVGSVRQVARCLGVPEAVVVLAAGETRRIPALPDVEQVSDPGEGPLGGLVSGLTALHDAGVVTAIVLAVDYLDPSIEILRMAHGRLGEHDAVVPVVEGRSHHLHAVFRVAALSELRAAYGAGERAVHRALERLDVDWWGDWPAAEAGFERNANRPQDLT